MGDKNFFDSVFFQSWTKNRVQENAPVNPIWVIVRIFSLTTSQSRKWIPKADLEWEDPCFYTIFFWSLSVNLEKCFFFNDLSLYFQKVKLTVN